MPFPSGSNTLNALRMVSSGSVPERKQLVEVKCITWSWCHVFQTSRLTFQLLSEHGQEDSEVDGTRSLLHHLIQLIVANI